jgi:hypothetical protein
VELSRGEINVEKLTACQVEARDGLYASATAAYLRWMAGRYEQLRQELPSMLEELRHKYHSDEAHARTGGILADLAAGWKVYLRFALETGAITSEEAQNYQERVRAGLVALGQMQAAHQEVAEPAGHFMRLIRSALASGRAHIASILGFAPANATAWGWRSMGNGEHQEQGRRIGWLDGEAVYLDPEAAHAEAQKLASEANDSLSITCQTLGKRLRERNYLTAIDQDRNRLTVRKTCQEARRAVWQLHAKSFLGSL